MWERACSRMRFHIQQRRCLTQRFREQARSHRDCGGSVDVAAVATLLDEAVDFCNPEHFVEYVIHA